MGNPVYIDVLLPLPVYGTFTYAVNEKQASVIQTGMRVFVPFGKKKTIPRYA
jgi:primosomal protein N' (replication factor Y)